MITTLKTVAIDNNMALGAKTTNSVVTYSDHIQKCDYDLKSKFMHPFPTYYFYLTLFHASPWMSSFAFRWASQELYNKTLQHTYFVSDVDYQNEQMMSEYKLNGIGIMFSMVLTMLLLKNFS